MIVYYLYLSQNIVDIYNEKGMIQEAINFCEKQEQFVTSLKFKDDFLIPELYRSYGEIAFKSDQFEIDIRVYTKLLDFDEHASLAQSRLNAIPV